MWVGTWIGTEVISKRKAVASILVVDLRFQ